MSKQLRDLVSVAENNRDFALFSVKEGVKPFDLIRLGFSGDESFFRVSKDPQTVGLTIFHAYERPQTMNIGSSNTIVEGDLRKVRQQIMEMVNVDFGITTGGNTSIRSKDSFDYWVERTSGPRDLDSLREFEFIKAPGGDGSLFVNGQHVTLLHADDLDQWLAERNILMAKSANEEPAGNGCTIIKGEFERLEAPLIESKKDLESAAPRMGEMSFGDAIDKAFDEFLSKAGWQGLDAPSLVAEFVRFAKQDFAPSLDGLLNEAKERATEKNATRPQQEKDSKPPSWER